MMRDAPGFVLRTARARGPLFRAKMGGGGITVVAHPDDLRYVLQENARNYIRGRTVNLIRPLLGNGLALSDGDFWLRQRRTMQPAFTRGSVAALGKIMAAVAERHVERLTLDAPMDAHAFFTVLARDVIVETMFSDSLANEQAGLDDAFAAVSSFAASRSFSPVSIPLSWPLPSNVRFRDAIARIDRTVKTLVARRRAGERRGDLLDALLDARDPETGAPMPEESLRDELVTIFFAGHETTANLLTWTCVALSQHPAWAEKMRDELRSVAPDRALDARDVAALPVTNAILREALRLYPPAWIFAREAVEDDALRGHPVARGQMLLLAPYVTHRLEAYWPDPDRFDPERFLRNNPFTLGGAKEPHFIPFGAGPHVCIGNHFAITEAVIILGALARRGRLAITHPERVRATMGVTLVARPTDARLLPWD
jgi:cytochrome P450